MGEPPRLKPQTIPEILDTSFRIYRENFALFVGLLAVIYVPAQVLNLVVTAPLTVEMQNLISDMQKGSQNDNSQVLQKVMINNSIIFGFPLATGALTRAVSRRYLNEPTSLGDCYGFILKNFGRYLGTALLSGLVIGLGFMMCAVPGILFAVWFVFTSSVVVLEGLGGTNAMGRSKQLSKEQAGRIIGMWFINMIITIPLSLGINAASGLAVRHTGFSTLMQYVTQQGIQDVMNLLLTPFFSVAWILLYYDIRIRKEGFDLEVLARSMAGNKGFFQPPPGPAGPPPAA